VEWENCRNSYSDVYRLSIRFDSPIDFFTRKQNTKGISLSERHLQRSVRIHANLGAWPNSKLTNLRQMI
jgi:hypothetical protein